MLRKLLLISTLSLFAIAPMPARAAEAEHATHNETAAAGEGERKHEVIEFDAATAVWVLIIFTVLLVVLYKTAWKNVLAGLKAREQKIRQDITDAEAARKRAEETLKQYNEQLATAEGKIRDMMAKASADAEKLATSLRMQAQQEAEEAKDRATREIEAARVQAVAEFRQYAADISTNIAEKILRRNLNPNDQKDLVNQSLEQLQTAGKV